MENTGITEEVKKPTNHNSTLLNFNNPAIVHPSNAGDETCPTCSGSGDRVAPQYIYAIGKIQPRFTSVGVEKEFLQATSREKTDGLSDHQAFHDILSEPKNRYLARKLCWVFSIEGLETYILHPSSSVDLDTLVESLLPAPNLTDMNIVIGVKGPIAPSNYCNGLQIPMVVFSQIYSFDVNSLIKSIPKPDKVAAKDFAPIAEELFMKIRQMTDNAGATDDHRVLNYLAVRYHVIYATASECYQRNCSLTGVDVLPSGLSGTRKIVKVIFIFTNRNTDVTEKYFCRVDITEEFPFLVSKMQTYFDRLT